MYLQAMLTAMSNFLELRKYMWPGPECNFVHVEFVTGRVGVLLVVVGCKYQC
jgi:hypothetical protein